MKEKEFNIKEIVNIQELDFSNSDAQKEILNVIETLCNMVISLKSENQQLKDEINILKGEQGKPNIKANTKSKKDDINDTTDSKSKMEKPKKSGVKAVKKIK